MGKAARIIIIAVLVGILGYGIFAANTPTPVSSKIWDERQTIGSPDAKNLYVVYSDIMCPYCVAFENAIFEHEDEFEEYLAENDILFEVRISNYLYNYGEGHSEHSKNSTDALFCARDEGKFWDYYKIAITTIWDNYFGKYGKAAYMIMSEDLDLDYWINLGLKIGLGDKFKSCVENEETFAEANKISEKMAKEAGGMPYFQFGKYTTSGFDLSWGWNEAKYFLDAGLNKK